MIYGLIFMLILYTDNGFCPNYHPNTDNFDPITIHFDFCTNFLPNTIYNGFWTIFHSNPIHYGFAF